MSPPSVFVAASQPKVRLNMFLVSGAFREIQKKTQGSGNTIIIALNNSLGTAELALSSGKTFNNKKDI